MFHIALYQPEIPPNTGNIIRLCHNAGAQLHLIHPLGFSINDKHLRRAGLDYLEQTSIVEHASYQAFLDKQQPQRLIACSTKGKLNYTQLSYGPQDTFLFGPETKGLPLPILKDIDCKHTIRIPMMLGSRCLNLSNSVAIVLYEAWRQTNFQSGC